MSPLPSPLAGHATISMVGADFWIAGGQAGRIRGL